MTTYRLKGYRTELIINEDTTKEQIAEFIGQELNHYIQLVRKISEYDEKGIGYKQTVWTYELTYCSIPNPDGVGRVFDKEKSVEEHTNLLCKYIKEDLGIEVK